MGKADSQPIQQPDSQTKQIKCVVLNNSLSS
jgi:hypothetical protein